jgi:hypothetical protein
MLAIGSYRKGKDAFAYSACSEALAYAAKEPVGSIGIGKLYKCPKYKVEAGVDTGLFYSLYICVFKHECNK